MSKANDEIILTGVILDDSHVFSLQEIKEKLHVEEDFINEMFEYGLIEGPTNSLDAFTIDLKGLRRLTTALHLYHDLEVNLAGAALVLELMEELEKLRAQTAIMEKHLK